MATLKHQLITLLRFRPLWRFALLLSVVAIGFLATTSGDYPIPSAPSDKVNHIIAFVELTVLVRLSWPNLRVIWFVPVLLGFGVSIEAAQANLPYRDFSLADIAADGTGVLIGLLPWPGLRRTDKTVVRDSPESV
ncbi:VanZ family protein [Marinobacter sp. ANT_B65]|uniref:VanZ family protein n=1 Tax=Marinobacter sp. ANT_B65 TaxID=2039467 RepID=UPI000BBF36E2|nr:VanZ family protein [Marinobacter sp. ANT_B65]PCM42950.1 teicoplanin resistance protein VanZ [Marinobacter sp. ANT_B65]